jgi:hypothetical protein
MLANPNHFHILAIPYESVRLNKTRSKSASIEVPHRSRLRRRPGEGYGMAQDERSHFHDGTIAQQSGIGRAENPYSRGTSEWMAWLAGWNVSEEEQAIVEQETLGRASSCSSVRLEGQCRLSTFQDPWEDPILIYLAEHPHLHVVSASELLVALGQAAQSQTRIHSWRVGRVLRHLGWRKRSIRLKSGTTQRFVSPEYKGRRAEGAGDEGSVSASKESRPPRITPSCAEHGSRSVV